MSDTQGYPGWQDAFAKSKAFNALTFMIRQAMAEASHVALVVVKKVTANQTDGAPPLVDVQPMVHQIDQIGTAQPHATITNIPTFRVQAGNSAFICDPKVGDIGAVIVADRDSKSAIKNQAPANPGSFRRFDWSDSMYLGGFGSIDPTTFVKLDDDDGITIQVAAGNPLTINADTINIADSSGSGDTSIMITGDAEASGTITGDTDVVGNGVSLHDHTHSGVTTGSGDTGPPN